MDEFANMPPLTDVDAMVSAARSRNIKLSFIIQNFSQLNDVYGKEKAETIRGNCGNTIYLLSTELAALEEISKMCGEVKSKKDDKTDSRPLVTVTDLQKLKEEEAIILRSRMHPYKTKLKWNYKIDWGKKYENAGYPEREKRTVAVFDLKKYVSEKRDKKINEMLSGMGDKKGGMPPFPGMPGLPNMSGSGMPGLPGMSGSGLPNMPPFPGISAMDSNKPNQPGNKGLNVDELVKRIDAKIAELEEEEKREKEKLAKKNSKSDLNHSKVEPIDMKKESEDSKKDSNGVTDDQFFDDFFYDE